MTETIMTYGDLDSNEKGTAARASTNKARFDLMPVDQLAFLQENKEELYNRRECATIATLLDVLGMFQAGQATAKDVLIESVAYNMSVRSGLTILESLEETCAVWLYGLGKYACFNWAKGAPWSIPMGCMIRHIRDTAKDPLSDDAESGLPHRAHIICNAMMLVHYERYWNERSKSADDRPLDFFK